MSVKLELGLEITEIQPDCVKAKFTSAGKGGLTIAKDNRGTAFMFDRLESPAVFIEFVDTRQGGIRGNHVHQYCDEALHVVKGRVEIYLLCEHRKHVLRRNLTAGEVVVTPSGVPHALYSVEESQCVVLFGQDPRNERTRIPILKF